MLSLYQRSGRLSTEIIPKVELLVNNRINLTYEITESDIAKVSKIIILGNEVFTSSKIKSIMKTKEFKNGVISATLGSLWWGVLGTYFFQFITFVGTLEVVVHRCIWTSFILFLSLIHI